MIDEYTNEYIINLLIAQHKINDDFVSLFMDRVTYLKRRISDLETELEVELKDKNKDISDLKYIQDAFFEKHPNLIKEFVEIAYGNDLRSPEFCVKNLHSFQDLSKIDCTGDDFKSYSSS